MGCIALVRCVLLLRCGLAVVVWYPYAGWDTIKMMHGPINITQLTLYPIYYADDMFRPLWAIFRSQKRIMRKLYSVWSLVEVHIVNFQRELVVGWFIHIELILSPTSKVHRVSMIYKYVVLYVLQNRWKFQFLPQQRTRVSINGKSESAAHDITLCLRWEPYKTHTPKTATLLSVTYDTHFTNVLYFQNVTRIHGVHS